MRGPVTRKMLEAGMAQIASIPTEAFRLAQGKRTYEQACEDAVVRIYRAMEDASEAPGPTKS